MKFEDIYNFTIKYWPERILIKNGYKVGKSGFMLPSLSGVWHKVGRKVGIKNPFYELMTWTMFNAFHCEGKNLFEEGRTFLSTRKVSKDKIRKRYFKNLHGESWEQELEKYKKSNSIK
ncbi:MAG: hypothetical protein HYS07_06160 [Chlamydiae bacterium]|nr:hypothetical protein [Chlamydiota bacterium]MBI3276278.1 hypothetical protein [Chlamydiota bacterium]